MIRSIFGSSSNRGTIISFAHSVLFSKLPGNDDDDDVTNARSLTLQIRLRRRRRRFATSAFPPRAIFRATLFLARRDRAVRPSTRERLALFRSVRRIRNSRDLARREPPTTHSRDHTSRCRRSPPTEVAARIPKLVMTSARVPADDRAPVVESTGQPAYAAPRKVISLTLFASRDALQAGTKDCLAVSLRLASDSRQPHRGGQ